MAWLLIVEWLARLILVALIGLSIWSIAIILERRRFFKALEEKDESSKLFDWIQSGAQVELSQYAKNHDGLRSGTVQVLLGRKSVTQMEKSAHSFWARQRPQIEKGLPILGTLGSTTPFVGLLGTILGIIVAFGELSTGQLDSQKVMFALAEALLLTAVGLGVAIPAVVAYNYFTRRLLMLLRECEAIKDAMAAQFTEGG